MENYSQNRIFENDILNFKCPITHQIMANPVDNIFSNTFEEEAIRKWFESSSIDPLTLELVSDKSLHPNKALKKIIDNLLNNNENLIANDEVYFMKDFHETIKYLILNKDTTRLKRKLSTLIDFRYLINNFADSNLSAFYLSLESGSVETSQLIFDYIFEKNHVSKLKPPTSNWKAVHLNGLIKLYNDSSDKGKYLNQNFKSALINTDISFFTNELLSINDTETLISFLSKKKISLNKKDDTLILKAAIYNNECLFEHLASLNHNINATDSNGLNCFYYAIKNQNLKILNFIMQKHDYRSNVFTPIKIAIDLYPDNYYLFDKIIQFNPDYLNITNLKLRTVIFLACKRNNFNLVDYLLSKNILDINHLDINKENCLHIAVKIGNRSIISLLVKKGVDVNQKNNKSKSPFDLAEKCIKNLILNDYHSVVLSSIKEINLLKTKVSDLVKNEKLNKVVNKFKDNVYIMAVGNRTGKINLIDLLSGKKYLSLNAHTDQVLCLEFGLDGSLFSCSADSQIKQWDLESETCVKTLKDKDSPYMIKIISDIILISIGRKNIIKKWDLNRSLCVGNLFGHMDRINCCVKIENLLITGSADKTIRIWDLNTENCVNVLLSHQNSVNFVGFLNENTFASVSSDLTFKFWDFKSSSQINHLNSFNTNRKSQDFDILLINAEICGKKRIFYSSDFSIYGIELNSENNLTSFSGPLIGHSGDIIKLFCLDDEKLVSASYNGEIKIWNLNSFQCIKSLNLENFEIISMKLMSN